MFNHFIITRFNVPFKSYENDREGNGVRDENWLNNRFDLFEKVCFPSVLHQLNKNFVWLVFFDITTPDVYKSKISDYCASFPNFKSVFVASEKEFYDKIHSIPAEILKRDNFGYIITTRLDNDDALHFNFINRVQSIFDKQSDIIINFVYGYKLDLRKNTLYKIRHLSNPFLTRIENVMDGSFNTVMQFDHLEAAKYAYVNQLKEDGWLIIIHDRNLANEADGRPVLFARSKIKSFNMNISVRNFRFDFPGLVKYYYIQFRIHLKSLHK